MSNEISILNGNANANILADNTPVEIVILVVKRSSRVYKSKIYKEAISNLIHSR